MAQVQSGKVTHTARIILIFFPQLEEITMNKINSTTSSCGIAQASFFAKVAVFSEYFVSIDYI